MLDEIYVYKIEKLQKKGYFNEKDECLHCSAKIEAETLFEKEGAMRIHLETMHNIKLGRKT